MPSRVQTRTTTSKVVQLAPFTHRSLSLQTQRSITVMGVITPTAGGPILCIKVGFNGIGKPIRGQKQLELLQSCPTTPLRIRRPSK